MSDSNLITLVDENGDEVLAEVILTHENEGKNYVIFQVRDSEVITAGQYVPTEGNEGAILDVETEEEWEMLQDILNEYLSELEEDGEEE